MSLGKRFWGKAIHEKSHIPTDFVVVQEASDVESSWRLDRLMLHDLRRGFVA